VVFGRYGSRGLELAIAMTGVVATMPYIALQLVGMEVVIKALGLTGELPLAAFVILALYTYSAGLRAPALIAFVKDLMIYIVVLVAVVLVPMKLGGYGQRVPLRPMMPSRPRAARRPDAEVGASTCRMRRWRWARRWRPSCIRTR
jgi:Na+/proline symporter